MWSSQVPPGRRARPVGRREVGAVNVGGFGLPELCILPGPEAGNAERVLGAVVEGVHQVGQGLVMVPSV